MRYSVEVKFNSSGRIQVNGNEIIISIKSEPKHGKANREMIKKMSNFFGVPENRIYIISGQTSRKKIIEIQNISKQYRFYKMGGRIMDLTCEMCGCLQTDSVYNIMDINLQR